MAVDTHALESIPCTGYGLAGRPIATVRFEFLLTDQRQPVGPPGDGQISRPMVRQPALPFTLTSPPSALVSTGSVLSCGHVPSRFGLRRPRAASAPAVAVDTANRRDGRAGRVVGDPKAQGDPNL